MRWPALNPQQAEQLLHLVLVLLLRLKEGNKSAVLDPTDL